MIRHYISDVKTKLVLKKKKIFLSFRGYNIKSIVIPLLNLSKKSTP